MKTIFLIAAFFITSTAFAKVIKEGTKDYDDETRWNVGDEVEGFGKVTKKEIKGKKVFFAFDRNGTKIKIRFTKK